MGAEVVEIASGAGDAGTTDGTVCGWVAGGGGTTGCPAADGDAGAFAGGGGEDAQAEASTAVHANRRNAARLAIVVSFAPRSGSPSFGTKALIKIPPKLRRAPGALGWRHFAQALGSRAEITRSHHARTNDRAWPVHLCASDARDTRAN